MASITWRVRRGWQTRERVVGCQSGNLANLCDFFSAAVAGGNGALKSLFGIGRAARWRVDRAGKGAGAGISGGGLGANGGCDGSGEFLAIIGIADEAAFGGVTKVAAFQQDAGDLGVAGQADAAAHQAAGRVAAGADAGHGLLQAGGETVAVDAPEVSLGAAAFRRAAVVVQANEDGGTRAVGADDPLVEVNEAVISAHEHDFEVAAEGAGGAFGGVEREVFFFLAGDGADRPAVFAAVTGVDDDSAESFRARAVAVNVVTVACASSGRLADGAGC